MEKIIVIVGPTGVGKTKLSILLANSLNGEVINADSMQIYKQLNIGTAKIKDNQKENIPHHLLDIRDITDDYSVYAYQRDCREMIKDIKGRKKTPIIVGGTGLYIKAALYDYKFKEETASINDYSNYSNQELYNMLKKFDANTTIHINNRKRIERAISSFENNKDNVIDNNNGNILLYDVIFIGLTLPRDILYNRINSRVDDMFKEGLLEEAKDLYDKNVRSKAIDTAIGYKEIYQYLDNKISKEAMIELIKKNSRRYAKRQYTWFNNQMNINWFDVDIEAFNNTYNKIYDYIKNNA
jgi:tRNA dimethylallyltransferase